jgi:hypothetical protein
MYQIPHGEVHILHIYICVHTPHVRDTGRSPHGAGPGATDIKIIKGHSGWLGPGSGTRVEGAGTGNRKPR